MVETVIEGQIAFVDFKLRPGMMTTLHTEVPQALEVRGIAAALCKQVLGYIATEKTATGFLCPYRLLYLKRHPEY